MRLLQGDYDREIDFELSPVEAAQCWVDDGAQWLHVVDLDGALNGQSANLKDIRELVAAVDVPVQLGGGLRTDQAVEAAFGAGVTRVVLGTEAVRNPEFAERMAQKYGDRIVVSIDSRRGYLAVDGWTNMTSVPVVQALSDMSRRGVSTVIYTPIEVDGMEQGPQLEELREAASGTNLSVIYASGIGSIEHIKELGRLGLPNLIGVIVGTALYRGRFKIRQADKVLRDAFRSRSLSRA